MKLSFFLLLVLVTAAFGQTHAPLSQQKMCDDAARKAFNKSWTPSVKDGISYEYTSHYDAKESVCYVLVHGGGVSKSSGFPTASYALFDAIEGREYGNYIWINSKKKKYWDVPPMMCSVKPRGSDEVLCHSDDEFEKLIDKYFGISR